MKRRLRIKEVKSSRWLAERGRHGLSLIPHLFTLANLAFGLFAIIAAAHHDFLRAAWLIVGSLLADGLDGRAARLLGADGDFGRELDSLADIVSFGAAPAVILYLMTLHSWGPWGLVLAAIFPMCGALRLARFNLIKNRGYFVGLPITAAGGIVAALTLYHYAGGLLPASAAAVALASLAYLMISNIPYPDFKKRGKREPNTAWKYSALALATLFVLLRQPLAAIFLPLVLYAILGPYLLLLKWVGHQVEARR